MADAAKRPFVVVLTGGPSSGKSSALALLKDRLNTRGFQVLTIPEMATHLLINSDGFQPEWVGTEAQVQVQCVFIDFQLAQEAAFTEIAVLHPTKRPVLILDACALSPKVYLNNEQWEHALNFPGKPVLSEKELLARYDLVIHMVTCAHGVGYEYGPGSNNPGRFHNREQAKSCDERALEVFRAHPQLRVVPNFDNFEDKIGKVVEFVNDALHLEGMAGRRQRRRCRVTALSELSSLVALPSATGALVTSTFLDDDLQHSVRRHARISGKLWLEKFQHLMADQPTAGPQPAFIDSILSASKPADGIEHGGEVTYERRTKLFPDGPLAKPCLTRKAITPEDYYLAVESCSKPAVTTKLVLRFLVDSSYYELFFTLNQADLVLVLDFAAGDSHCNLSWLEFSSLEDLTRHDSDAKPLPTPKRQRFLRAHSTEEAAYAGS